MVSPKAKRPLPRNPVKATPARAWPKISLAQWTVVVCLLCGALVRAWATCDEFWMDEIWSLLDFAGRANSPLDLFTYHHDNNHYLVTLWMYILSPNRGNWILYRLPSLAAGIGTTVLACRFARRWGTVATIAAAILTSASFVLITLASEARGYALAGFFALAAWLLLERFLATGRWRTGFSFVGATMLGVLSHLTFVQVYGASLVWSCVACWRRSGHRSQAVRQLAVLHAPPLGLLALLYFCDIRFMRIGGGEPRPLGQVVLTTLGLTIGCVTKLPAAQWGAAILVFATSAVALYWLWRGGSDLWMPFAFTIFVAPAALLLLFRPELLYERYFYLNILFFLLLASYFLAQLWQYKFAGRAAVVLALTLFVAGNAIPTYELLRVGRGHFLEVLEYLAENTAGRDIHLANSGLRTRDVVYTQFYSRYLPNQRFVFDDLDPAAELPEWVVLAGSDHPFQPPAGLEPMLGRGKYKLVRVFPYAGLSGFHFAVYHYSGRPKESP